MPSALLEFTLHKGAQEKILARSPGICTCTTIAREEYRAAKGKGERHRAPGRNESAEQGWCEQRRSDERDEHEGGPAERGGGDRGNTGKRTGDLAHCGNE